MRQLKGAENQEGSRGEAKGNKRRDMKGRSEGSELKRKVNGEC